MTNADCPIGWQPSALLPVFYGSRELDTSEGPPMPVRIFFPSIDGAVDSAPLLRGCGRYPLVVFLHGQCPDDTDHFRRWHRLPAQLARAGYVVLVPNLVDIDTHPGEPDHPDQQRLVDLVDWARTRWGGREVLMPSPATGVAGHSWGAMHAGLLAPKVDAAAVGLLSGRWSELGDDNPLFHDARPRLLTWGVGSRSEITSELNDRHWALVSKPKHRARFTDAEHWDYLYNVQFPCGDPKGPCRYVGNAADDLLTMFFARYLPPERSPWLADRIPPDLRPPRVERTLEQEFFAGSFLGGLALFESLAACRVEIDFELLLDHVVPLVRHTTRTVAARRVREANLIPVFTGSPDPDAFVFSQSPRERTRVPAGTDVRMNMRTGRIP